MDMTLFLIIAGAGIIIGILIGLMINALRGEPSKRTVSPSELDARAIDNILLWHDRSGGNLIVDIDGATFTGLSQMRSDQRARLETCYGQLKRFLGVQEVVAQTKEIEKEIHPPVLTHPIETPQVRPVEIKLPIGKGKTEQNKSIPEPIRPLSIVAEIDEILQDMIRATALEERGLKLIETPNHTISVWIDKKQYQSIEDVPEANIQEIIHASVKKWEDKLP